MVKLKVSSEGGLRVSVVHGETRALIQTDAPKESQGLGELFSPTDLLGAALGTCVITVMEILAKKLQVELTNLRADVEKEMTNLPSKRVGKITVHVYCPCILDPEIAGKLEQVAIGCPVHESLHPAVEREIVFHWGQD
jgi:putative redox protein